MTKLIVATSRLAAYHELNMIYKFVGHFYGDETEQFESSADPTYIRIL